MTLRTLVAAVLFALPAGCGGPDDLSDAGSVIARRGSPAPAAAATVPGPPVVAADTAAPVIDRRSITPGERALEDSIYEAAARTAWRFVDRNYVAATGLVRPFDSYPVATMWDIASGVAGLFSAAELGLVGREDYDRRMSRALATLERLPLFRDIGFNKEYHVETGRPIGIDRQPGTRGYGISATDHGRLLLWLGIVGNRHPQHLAAATRVARRLELAEFEEDGYLVGRQVSRRTGRTRDFQEGRIGYEQYAARGFSAWGLHAGKAADVGHNRKSRVVEGVELPADARGRDRLTSEPFILLGIEAGWTPQEASIAGAMLQAQEARFRRTGTLTMVSEDAINRAPDYFFYYTILSPHGPWTIDVQRPNVRVPGPRWVSTKGAFAWHALAPSAYTRSVVDTIARGARVRGVWGSGIFESGQATGNPNLNTAAVVLEAALYRKLRRPFLQLGPAA